MMPPEFISTESCDVQPIDTSSPCKAAVPSNGVLATLFHDAGAIAQCFYCRRYTLDRRALSNRPPTCECGKKHGWTGSFRPPGPTSSWCGAPPVTPLFEHEDHWTAAQLDGIARAVREQCGPATARRVRAVLALPAAPLYEARTTETRDTVIAECIAALRDVDDGEAPEFSACIEKLQELRMVAPQSTHGDAPMVWPEARDVGRIGDMSPSASMRVGLDSDNDVYVAVYGDDGGGSVEFCTPGSGGGKSPRTREALIALMVAMEAENADDSSRDWWARRNRKPTQGEGGA